MKVSKPYFKKVKTKASSSPSFVIIRSLSFTQMIAVMLMSQYLISSSRSDRPQRSFGVWCVGHTEMMWPAICSCSLHSQLHEKARPHLCMDSQNAQRQFARLNFTQAGLGRPISKDLEPTLGIKS